MIHSFISDAGIRSPYAIVPQEYCLGKWRQPREKFGHGTPEAYNVFAKISYQMIGASFLYPLDLKISIPPLSGDNSQFVEISDKGPSIQKITLNIPPDILPGAAIDIMLQCPRIAVDSDLNARSLSIVRIEQR